MSLFSVFGSAVAYLILGIADALWVLFLARIVGGMTAGNQSAAYISDVSTPETRAQNFTLIGMAWGIGLIVGPAAGAERCHCPSAAPAFAAALTLASLPLCYAALPESLPKERRTVSRLRLHDVNPFSAIGRMAFRPGLALPLLALCLFNLALNGVNSTETLYLLQRFQAQPYQLGALLALAGVVIILVQRVMGRFVARYGERRIALVSLLGQSVAVLATAFALALWTMFPLTMFRTVTSGLLFPTLTALLAGRVSPQEQGALMGVTTALANLMNIVGPLWADGAYDRLAPASPYGIGATIFLFAALSLSRAGAFAPSPAR